MTKIDRTDGGAKRLYRKLTGLARRLVLGRVPKLFDASYYLKQHPDAAASALDPYLHYVLVGGRRNYDPNADFDTVFYRTQVKTRRNPLRHYIEVGIAKGLDPHPQFSTFSYLGRYPDIVGGKTNPLQHYREHGRAERRIADPSAQVPRAMTALAGIPSAHQWTLPGRGHTRYDLTLLRTAPDDPAAEPIARLRLSLGLNFDSVDRVVGALARFPTGVQDAVHLALIAEPRHGGGVASLMLALDHCHAHPAAEDGTRVIRYAQAVVWDVRPMKPRVLANLPDGSLRVGPSP